MMTHSEAPISITIKSHAGSLVTLRADSPEELDQRVAQSLISLADATQELEAAIRGKAPVNTGVPPNPQIASVATSFGATDITTTYTQPTDSFSAPTTASRMCPHGSMTRIHGLAGKFGPYKGYFCPAKQGDMTKCTTQYIKANQPEWNSFQADQTKA